MSLYTPSSPHIHSPTHLSKVMLSVVLAASPGIILYLIFFGWGLLIHIILAISTALLCEALMLQLRQRPVIPFLIDGSAIVTALLLALSIPPIAPWWITVLGTAFAIIIAKHLYGGLGYNPFNPAMIGYVMLLISFPLEMTVWPNIAALNMDALPLSLSQSIELTFNGQLPLGINLDALSAATPLDYLKTQIGLEKTVDEVMHSSVIFGYIGAHTTEWISLAFLLGGLWLIYKKIISWHIPAALIGSMIAIATLFFLIDDQRYAPPWFHLLSGATMLGAFFIATDPVSAATTNRGRLIYGAGIGLLTYVIRTWGGYPDAIAFAVLLMNMSAPTIDYYTKPRVFGKRDD